MSVASVPLKTVLMYHADATNETIPVGYEVCDGRTLAIGTHNIGGGGASYTLPDLRNRFLVGADITKAATDPGNSGSNATDAPGPKGAGGVHARTLTSNELPSHSHTGTTDTTGNHTHVGSTTDAGGAHSHSGAISTAGAHSHAGSSISAVANHSHGGSSVATGGTHSHTLTDAGHNHQIYVGTTGDGQGGTGGGAMIRQGGEFSNSGTPMPAVNVPNSAGITIDANSGSHSHSLSMTADGGHSHTPTIVSDGDHTHTLSTTSAGSSHSHGISALSTDGNHSHTLTTNTTGSGNSFDSRPRYYGVIFIMKVRF